MRANVVEAVIGAVVLAIAGFFLHYAYYSGHAGRNGGYELTAKFDRIDGLILGNEVRLSGVKVGTIQSITIDPATFMAVVTLSVRHDLKLPQDTIAEIVSESFMGGKYIALVPGGAEENLKPGDAIAYTQSSISFESLIGKFLFSKSDDKDENPPQRNSHGKKS
jgi:phospholipid/cholesterol/gamma-HCH transport system substrate-binding protein